MSPDDQARKLVFDVCHELGNLIAAIRLQAHLLDEDLGPLGLARASLQIEGLGARTSALLSLIPPLFAGSQASEATASDVLAGVEDLLRDVGLRGVELQVEIEDDLPTISLDRHILHSLLAFLAADALEVLGGKGELRIGARRSREFVELFVVDDAASDPSLESWKTAGHRGRGLAVSAAERLLGDLGGHAEVERRENRTTVSLFAPA